MHIEKYVCDNLIGTLLNIEGKTKDNTNAQLDLQVEFCKFLKLVKFSDGFVSNIS